MCIFDIQSFTIASILDPLFEKMAEVMKGTLES